MKKVLATLVFLFLFNPIFVFAIQGDCSSHNGVNCEIGPDIDGSVICNDGWADGRNSYLDAEMCGLDCSVFMELKLDADQKANSASSNLILAEDKNTRCESFTKSKLVADGVPLESSAAIEIINRAVAECQAEVDYYRNLVNENEASAITFQNQYENCESTRIEILSFYNEIIDLKKKEQEDLMNIEKDFKDNCLAIGNTQYLTGGNCYCKTGYHWNENQTGCIKTLICPKNSTQKDGVCICNEGYEASNDECILIKDNKEQVELEEAENIENSESYNEDEGLDKNISLTFRNDANKSQFSNAIIKLREKRIINGYPDETFKPFNPINRAEFTKIVMEASDYNISGSNCFSDVTDQWFAQYVCSAKENGIIGGYPDGTFKPEQTVNVAEAMKITLNAFKIWTREAKDGEEWYDPFIEYANANNLYLNTFESSSKLITREEMAEIIYRLIK